MCDNRVSLGIVIALEYKDSLFDPHEAFQKFKTRSSTSSGFWKAEAGTLWSEDCSPIGGLVLDAAKLFRWRADHRRFRELAEFAAAQKGIHTAIKSGMLAAETIYEALAAGDTSSKTLSAFQKKIEASWIKPELWAVRNFHQGFHKGLWRGIINAGLQFITGGRGLVDPMRARAGYEDFKKLNRPLELVDQSTRFKGDGTLTFDRFTDVYHSGTRHEEDQPCHLVVADLNICADRCVREYGNPCQYYCPAAVYEMVLERASHD